MEQKMAKLRILEKKRNTYFQRVQQIYDLIQDLSSHATARSNFIIRYQTIETTRSDFNSLVDEINDLALDIDPQAEPNFEMLSAFDDLYGAILIAHAKLTKQQSDMSVKSEQPETQPDVQIQLPRIQIKPFTGQICDWPEFRDIFTAVIISNMQLSTAQKYHYLRTSLEPEALKIIKTFPLSAEHFESAWSSLKERYENKRLLASHFFDEMFSREGPPARPSVQSLQNFLTQFNDAVVGLNNLKIEDLSDLIILNLALRRLDPETVRAFEKEQVSSEIPKYENLVAFIKHQMRILELTAKSASTSGSFRAEPSKPKLSRRILLTNNYSAPLRVTSTSSSPSGNRNGCRLCHSPTIHPLYKCSKFHQLSPELRLKQVKSMQVCKNCLSTSHGFDRCLSTSRCRACGAAHHSMVHVDSKQHASFPNKPTSSVPTPLEDRGEPSKSTCMTNAELAPRSNCTVLLGTALLHLKLPSGEFATIRALIDPASTRSCISQECVHRLGLPVKKARLPFAGLGGVPVVSGCGLVTCIMKPRSRTSPCLTSEAVVIPEILQATPPSSLSQTIINQFTDIYLADPSFGESGPVDYLLGADTFLSILTSKPNRNLYRGMLHTIFGNVIMGPLPLSSDNMPAISFCTTVQDDLLASTLHRFWESEEVPTNRLPNPADDVCEQHFITTHRRNSEGRYIVKLPFTDTDLKFPQSHEIALKRFLSLERRLSRDPELKQKCISFLKEYADLGHMQLSSSPAKYYLPYFCVHNPNSVSTPVRVVFDGSAKQSDRSINDALYPGPKLQKEVPDIMLNFRIHTYVFCCDIIKMFRQILIDDTDRTYLHILYRENPDEQIRSFQLNTVTYGLSCSPYQAQRVLIQLVNDEGAKFPLASRVIREDTFMDDIITGSDSHASLYETAQQLIHLLRAGGFHLSKWISNSSEFLSRMHDTSSDHLIIKRCTDNSVKVLGVRWEPTSDAFSYQIVLPSFQRNYTKRSVLSMIAGIYDPLGFIAPLTFCYKYFVQKLWRSGLSWDDPLPDELASGWLLLTQNLTSLSKIRIPRCVLPPNYHVAQVIGFSDASEKGYGCVVYLRVLDATNQPQISLLMAKSKVAPLKPCTVPRLELAGALLLSRTLSSLKPFLSKLNTDRTYLFTDSTIVLSWLHKHPHTLKMFVGNRVSAILENTNLSDWQHVSTENNPADIVSRGLDPVSLSNSLEWFQGPSWLQLPPDEWPQPVWSPLPIEHLPEIKSASTYLTTPEEIDVDWMRRISSFFKILRVQAYVSRFLFNCRRGNSTQRKCGPLNVQELRTSLYTCVRQVQAENFSKEIFLIKENKLKSSRLLPLSPFMSSGLIRVGGRLANAAVPYSTKHPLLLPKHSHFTHSIIDDYHRIHLHAGPRTLRYLIQRKFWIISAHSVIRQRIRLCTTCNKFSSTSPSPIMAHLPPARVTPSRPFLHCGVDLAGPILIKETLRRKSPLFKAYFALFICMATKAVHIEVLTSLTTEAFLSTLARFVARRGLPSEIYCDQGTNFKGASRELKEVVRFLRSQETNEILLNELSRKEIQFHFTCPKAPFMGGLWESNIKNVKFHLRRVLGTQTPTLEELLTLLSRIEATLNSRPLCDISPSPEEPDALTPGHFLIGSPLLDLPEVPLTDLPVNRLSRWQLVSQMHHHFWKRWSDEYLLTLQQRTKWSQPSTANLKPGQLVWIKEDGASPLTYPLGIIQEAFPNPVDGVVRIVSVRTASGLLQRPVRKLAPLVFSA